MNTLDSRKKRFCFKPKKIKQEQNRIFWEAHPDTFFGDPTISVVTGRSIKTLQCDRWRKSGIPFRKVGGRVLYKKSDVVTWLESHPLVHSTSEYKPEDK